jgi:hypothetical protein
LVAALEIERRDISAARQFALAEQHDIRAAGDFLPYILFVIERVAALIDITEIDRLADLDLALVGLLLSGDEAEERGLARAVRPDSDDLLEESERQVFYRLSIFAGGCTLDAAEAVSGGDGAS